MDAITSGSAPGLAAPEPAALTTNDEAPRLAGAEGSVGQGQDDTADCAEASAQRKRVSTLAARLALAGWALSRGDAGDGPATFLASRWGMVAPELRDLAAVESFADRVGAPA